MKAKTFYDKFPIRQCRGDAQVDFECSICKAPIVKGQDYYSGGSGLDHRRAHVVCVERLRLEKTKELEARRALLKG